MPGSEFDAATAVEVVAGRQERSTLYRNPDGSETVVLSSVPVHYQGDGGWLPIDSRLIADGNGGFRNAANSWTMRVITSPVGAVSGAKWGHNTAMRSGDDVITAPTLARRPPRALPRWRET